MQGPLKFKDNIFMNVIYCNVNYYFCCLIFINFLYVPRRATSQQYITDVEKCEGTVLFWYITSIYILYQLCIDGTPIN